MKILLLSIIISVFSCNSAKQSVANEAVPEGTKVISDSLPACVRALIDKFKSEEPTNPPRKIYSYIYAGKKVYYVTAVCCDNYSDLYNDSCRLIAHPDGGFTGRGDGKITDFDAKKSNEKLLWADSRKK